jgi:hypothetical protein
MTDKKIENRRKVGSDCFGLQNIRKANNNLEFYLNQFDPNNYWIFKATQKQKLVSIEELIEFKYACYILFKKDKYNPDNILKWCQIIKPVYLVKPVPPDYMLDRIKIIT